MRIFNGTTHNISFFHPEDTEAIQGGRKLIVKDGAKPFLTIPAGENLNAQKGNLPSPAIASEIPLKGAVTFTGYDPIPEGYDLIVCSNLYRSAVKELGGDTSRLATVDGAVYEDETAVRPCGVTALAVG